MSRPELVAVRGVELWGWVVETDSGFRVRFDAEEWDRLRLYRGQRVAVRRPSRGEELLFIAEDVSLPPLVWVVFAVKIQASERLRAGGQLAG